MKPQYFNVIVAVAVATGVVCSNTCTDISRIRQLRQNITLSVSTFLTMANYTLVICAKECLLRSYCRSFNFNLTSSNCQLNWLSSTGDHDRRLEPAVDSVFRLVDSISVHWLCIVCNPCCDFGTELVSSAICLLREPMVETRGSTMYELADWVF